MAKTILHFALLFVLLVAAQAIVFNHMCLFGVAVPLVFIYFLMRLPVTLGSISVMTLGFILGLTVDIFSDTTGMNALACTIIAALRLPLLRLYFPREEDLTNPEPSIRSLGANIYMKYAVTVVFVYCALFFSIEAFTFFSAGRLLARVIGSTLLTFILIICIDSLINQRSEKKL